MILVCKKPINDKTGKTKKGYTQMNFTSLVEAIQQIHKELAHQASHAVNVSLTLRNWMFGGYIHKYELVGSDRAKYGDRLIEKLSKSLSHIPRTQKRELNRYRQFYKIYPQIGETLSPPLKASLNLKELSLFKKGETPSPQSKYPDDLIFKLSFSHLDLLAAIEDNTKRTFYEVESIRGNWSVRELKRQINSLYYERSGLSLNKQKLSELASQTAEQASPALTIRDPYVFEFLGLKAREVMSESLLEDELLDKIQEFLLELGHGFCFEARQKRILIGKTLNFIDLVFYHRILKCHVLVELKLAEFSHENIGQLNTYVSWYKKNIMTKNDNPPVGILLCTDKDNALVEYALAGMDDNIFVSKYMLELPKKEEMRKFIEKQIRNKGGTTKDK
jgi:predicted nuclease of restriction endonuclease-like (RecB) superfamily